MARDNPVQCRRVNEESAELVSAMQCRIRHAAENRGSARGGWSLFADRFGLACFVPACGKSIFVLSAHLY
jgi:hypothetical protein